MSLPDLATNPDAVLGDDVSWRFKRAPDYSKTRKYFEESEYILWLFWWTAACQVGYQLAAPCSPLCNGSRRWRRPLRLCSASIDSMKLTSQPRRRTTSLVRSRRSSRTS